LRRARAAAADDDWPDALDAFEAAAAIVDDADPGVLGELAWARYQARRWCEHTQDMSSIENEYDARDEDDDEDASEVSPVYTLCRTRADLTLAQTGLDDALILEMSDPRRAMLLYNAGRVEAALGDPDAAAEDLRQSLCLREHPSVREAYEDELWSAGDEASSADLDEARRFYRQSLAIQANSERSRTLEAIEQQRHERFELVEVPADDRTTYPSLRELCRALLDDFVTEPLEPGEDVDACELSAWQDMAREGEPAWSVAHLHLVSPEMDDGSVGEHYLVGRTTAGISVLFDLGPEHGDSRRYSAYVDHVSIVPTPELPLVSFQVSWVSGTAGAVGCNWSESAAAELALCGWDGHAPRCFATASLGPVPFENEPTMPTIQESRGDCESTADLASPPLLPEEYALGFDVSVGPQEIVARRDDGALTCLPLRETLCALDSRPSVGCSD